MKIGAYTISGSRYPYPETDKTNQTFKLDGGGGVTVFEEEYVEEFFGVKFKADGRGHANDIRGFLKNGARFRAVPFTYVDDNGTSYLVRLWQADIVRSQKAVGIWEFNIVLRREIV